MKLHYSTGELAATEAVFTHGRELLAAINLGLQQFDVYENKSASDNLSSHSFQPINTYSYDSHSSYSLLLHHSSYRNLDNSIHQSSFGSIRQYEDNHITHCDHDESIKVGDFLIGSSEGSWAKENAVERDVFRTIENLSLHPLHLETRIEKGLTLLRQVTRTETVDQSGFTKCSKLHTVSIHPLELFESMRQESKADSPFQHIYRGKDPTEYADTQRNQSNSTQRTRKELSRIVYPDNPLMPCVQDNQYWSIAKGRGEDYSYKLGALSGCLEYSADLPGSFNYNYNPRTGNFGTS